MNNQYRLSYCKVCKNRKPDKHKGLLCGLTNTTPDFSDNCSDYHFDKIERDNLVRVKKISCELQDVSQFRVPFIKYPLDIIIIDTEDIQPDSHYDSIPLLDFYEFKKTITLAQFTLMAFLIIGSIFSAIYIFREINDDNYADILLILLIYLLLLYFIKPLKWIRKTNNKPRIIINDLGIIIERNIISWQEILFTHIREEKNKLSNSYYLVISKINSSKQMEYKIDYLDISYKNLGNLIERFKKRYWNKNSV